MTTSGSNLRAVALRTLWRATLRLHLTWVSWKLRCDGSEPAQCFIPTDDAGNGYYRYGILRQYCLRFRWHRGDCLADINEVGHHLPGGAFRPEARLGLEHVLAPLRKVGEE